MATTTIKEEHEILESSAEPRGWTFTDGESTITYTQKPMSFFRKIEFVSLLGDAVDKLSTNENPINLAVVFSGEATIDNFVAVIAKVAAEVPETLQEAYCIFLDVPKGERAWAKDRMENQLTDVDGFAIMDLFVEQNAEGLMDFFGTKGQGLIKRTMKKFGLSAQVPSSKPAKRTAPNTPKE